MFKRSTSLKGAEESPTITSVKFSWHTGLSVSQGLKVFNTFLPYVYAKGRSRAIYAAPTEAFGCFGAGIPGFQGRVSTFPLVRRTDVCVPTL